MSAPNEIVLFHYPYSPYARRILWYLSLRGIEYAQCLQPPVLPREDLSALGVKYRRIPILSIGRDIYCDTRLILKKLEQKFPDGALGATAPDQKGIERLLDRWTTDGGVFARGAQLIPPEMPVMKDPKFVKDRTGFTGRSWDLDAMKKARPEALVHIRNAFELLETTLMADGRDWILKTNKPSLADIEAIWPFDWLVDMKGALPPEVISAQNFPKVYAWIQRFRNALKAAKSSAPKATTLKGPEVYKYVTTAKFSDQGGSIDKTDPLGLQEGDEVIINPIDSGSTHKDQGRLVTLTPDEVVIAVQAKGDGPEIHIHMPRWGFRIQKAGAGSGSKL